MHKKSKILIVDDNKDSLLLLDYVLSGKYVVIKAQNGKQALKIIEKNTKPDLILLDINMPGIGGFEVCNTIKKNKNTKNIPIIFLTAYSDKNNILKAFEYGGVDIVTKPYNKQELLARINTQLKISQLNNNLIEKNKEINQLNDKYKNLNEKITKNNKKLTKANCEIKKLYEAAKSVLHTDNFINAAKKILNISAEITGANAGFVTLLDKKNKNIEKKIIFKTKNGFVEHQNNGIFINISGIREKVYKNKKAIYDNNYINTNQNTPKNHNTINNVMCAPLTFNGNILGIWGLANKPTDFTDDDLKSITALSELASLSLKNSITNEKLRYEKNYAQKSEKKLLKNFKFTQNLIENLPIPLFYLDKQGKYLGCNPRFEEFTGIKENQLLNKTVYEVWKTERAKIYYQKDLEAIEKEVFQSYEFQIKNADGTSRDVMFSKSPFYDENNNVAGLIGTFFDLTKIKNIQKQLQERIKESKAFYHISEILENKNYSLDDIYKKIVEILPQSWQYPDITYCKLQINDKIIKSGNYVNNNCYQKSSITINKNKIGEIIIGYTEKRPKEYDGPFLKEEKILLNSIAKRIGEITEFNIALNDLRENEEKFRLVFESSNAGKSITYPNGKILCNKAFCNILGYKQEDLINKTWQDITPKNDIPKVQKIVDKLNKGQINSARFEKRYIHKNGKIITTDLSTVINRDDNHKPLYFITTIVDITEHKKNIIKLKESEERYKTFIDSITDLVFLKDNNLKHLVVNKAMLNFLNKKENEVINKTSFELLPEKIALQCEKSDKEALKQNKLVTIIEYSENKIFEVRKFPVKLFNQKPGVGSIFKDITDKKRLENEEKKLQRRIKAGLDAGNFAWWEMELPSGKVIFDDKKAEILGYKPENFKHYNDFTNLIHPDDYEKVMQAMQKHLEGKTKKYNIEYRIKTKSGKYLWFRDFGEITNKDKNSDRTIITGIFENITKTKKAEEKIIKNEKKFRNIFENTNAIKLIINPTNGKIINANKAAADFYGWSVDELENMRIHDINIYENKQIDGLMNQVLDQNKLNFEFKHRKADNTISDVEIYTSKISINNKPYLYSIIHDITDKKNFEKIIFSEKEKAKENEKQFRQLFKNMKQGFVLLKRIKTINKKDTDYKIILANNYFKKIFKGFFSKKIENKTLRDILPIEEQEFINYINNIKHNNIPVEFDVYHKKQDKYYSVIAYSPKKDFIALIYSDITKNIKREQELTKAKYILEKKQNDLKAINQQYESLNEELTQTNKSLLKAQLIAEENYQQFKGLFQNMEQSFALLKKVFDNKNNSNDYIFILANNSFKKIINKTSVDLKNKSINEIPTKLKSKIIRCFKNFNHKQEVIETEIYLQDIEKYYKLILYKPKENYCAIIFSDITEKNQLIKSSELKFKTIVKSSPSAICIFKLKHNKKLILTDANLAALRIIKSTLNSIINKNIKEIFPNFAETKFSKICLKVAKKEIGNQSFETFYENKNFSGYFIFHIYSTHENHITIDFLDITEKKKAEIKLKSALEKEKKLSKMKVDFVSTASHQFRTPLTTLLSSTELLELLLPQLDENIRKKAERYINRLHNNIERMEKLLDDVLLVGRSQASRTPFNPNFFNLSEFIKRYLNKTKFEYQNNRKVELKIHGNTKKIYADSHLIMHIFQNLLSNAFKYSQTNPKLNIIYNEKNIKITIADEGIGIPEESKQNLFQSFYRAENARTFEGTGLGLVIVKEYVKLHNGTINYESTIGKGTTFTIILPYKFK